MIQFMCHAVSLVNNMLHARRNLTDPLALSRQHYGAQYTAETSVPPVYDVPVGRVCAQLYG